MRDNDGANFPFTRSECPGLQNACRPLLKRALTPRAHDKRSNIFFLFERDGWEAKQGWDGVSFHV